MDEKKKILIVEDEKDISEILAYNIKKQGYDVDTAFDGETGLNKALTGEFDLILLDVMLPKMDGFEICKRVREKLQTPIIILTAREEENDKIMGLDLGADDYMTKPFSIGELSSRIKANIRRYSGELKKLGENDSSDGTTIKIGDIVIDTENVSVKKNQYHRWTYEEDLLCCRRFFEQYVEQRSSMDLQFFAQQLHRELPEISVGSLRMKAQNIQQLCNEQGIRSNLAAKPLTQYSQQNRRAFMQVKKEFGL